MDTFVSKKLDRRLTLGIMSGTSLDGVDMSLVKFTRRFKVSEGCHCYLPFPRPLRTTLLALASRRLVEKDKLLAADRILGEFYADAAGRFLSSRHVFGTKLDLIGTHGQTVFHRASGSLRLTLQIGSPDPLAQRFGVPVVSDFRTADMVAGGRGAPLTPVAHFHLFGRKKLAQAVLNLGGISNCTYLPSRNNMESVFATDCGPGNMLLDQACLRMFGVACDKDGKRAARGKVDARLLHRLTAMGFLRRRLPVALGREQFGSEVVDRILEEASRLGIDNYSTLATIGSFTVHCIARVITRLGSVQRVLVCGGGARNLFLMSMLRDSLAGTDVADTSVEGVHPDFVESVAFAMLANFAVDRVPANLPGVTDARDRVILGKITIA